MVDGLSLTLFHFPLLSFEFEWLYIRMSGHTALSSSNVHRLLSNNCCVEVSECVEFSAIMPKTLHHKNYLI